MNDTHLQQNQLDMATAAGNANWWQAIGRLKYKLLIPPALFMAIALIAASFMTPMWEGVAILQLGKVATAPIGKDTPPSIIEDTSTAILRLNSRAFMEQLRNDLASTNAMQLDKGMKLRAMVPQGSRKEDGVIELTMRARSNEELSLLFQHILENFQSAHSNQFIDAMNRLEGQKKAVISTIENSQKTIKALKSAIQQHDGRTVTATMLVTLLQQEQTALSSYEDKLAALEQQLDSLHSFPTHIVGGISVHDSPTSPNYVLMLTLAFWLGIIVSASAVALLAKFGK